jgi:hypothetical protein
VLRFVRPAAHRRPTSARTLAPAIVTAALVLVTACSGAEADAPAAPPRPAASAAPSGSLPIAETGATVAPGTTDTTVPKYHPETVGHARLVALGIPDIAARAYLNASVRAGEALPKCTMPPEVLAAIGGQESRNGQVGGEFDLDGNSKEMIRGFAETGPDTDGGVLDGDTEKDWAVGPMQFTPETWKDLARDGNDDGRMDPNNFFDAAMAAAAYLCHLGGPFPSAAFIATQWNQWDQKVKTAKQRADSLHDQWQKEKDRRQQIQDFIDSHPDDTTDPQRLAQLPPLGPEPTYQEPDLLPGPAQFKAAVEGYYGPAGDTRDDYVVRVTAIFRQLTAATGGVPVTPDDRWS